MKVVLSLCPGAAWCSRTAQGRAVGCQTGCSDPTRLNVRLHLFGRSFVKHLLIRLNESNKTEGRFTRREGRGQLLDSVLYFTDLINHSNQSIEAKRCIVERQAIYIYTYIYIYIYIYMFV